MRVKHKLPMVKLPKDASNDEVKNLDSICREQSIADIITRVIDTARYVVCEEI